MKNIIPLQLPPAPLKLKRQGTKVLVWDEIRKKDLVLTPEEWVRQHWVHHLHQNLDYPLSAFALEGGFKLLGQTRRTDLLIYRQGKPRLIIECKAPQVKISQNTFDQALRYNLHYQVPYLLISNGLEHYWAEVDYKKEGLVFLAEGIPYSELG